MTIWLHLHYASGHPSLRLNLKPNAKLYRKPELFISKLFLKLAAACNFHCDWSIHSKDTTSHHFVLLQAPSVSSVLSICRRTSTHSLCGCSHDGKSGEEKLQRKQGRQPKPLVRIAKPSRSDVFMREVRAQKHFTSPPPLTPTTLWRPVPRCTDILRFFGEQPSAIEYVVKNLPFKNIRYSSQFWTTDSHTHASNNRSRSVIMNVYMTILICVAESCGAEGGVASLERFKICSENQQATLTEESIASAVKKLSTWTFDRSSKSHDTDKTGINWASRHSCNVMWFVFTRQLRSIESDIPSFYISRGSYKQGREDYDILRKDGVLPVKIHSRTRLDKIHVDVAIANIMSHENVSYLSWGNRRVNYNGRVFEAPSLVRKKPISVMFEAYKNKVNPINLVSRATFYRFCSALTNGQTQARKSVDYVTGFLVYDSVGLLTTILEDILPMEVDSIKIKMEIIQSWLKYGIYGVF